MTLQILPKTLTLAGLIIGGGVLGWLLLAGVNRADSAPAAGSGLLFIHHSVGDRWLNHSLRQALLAKSYINAVNDSFYGTDLAPDAGRPDSLAPLPGDYTDMSAWIFWFNDYLNSLKSYQNPGGLAALISPIERKITPRFPWLSEYLAPLKGEPNYSGRNRIVMFKSCFPNSNLGPDESGPGDPFSTGRTIANNQAIFRPAGGPTPSYTRDGYSYQALEVIFAQNPDTLFIVVTSPPLHFGPTDATSDEAGRRIRQFNQWLKTDWLAGYRAAHPDLNNVAVFDYFDMLAYPADHPEHPNRLKAEYGGNSGDSHPNAAANAKATERFATAPDNFLDQAWNAFQGQPEAQAAGIAEH